MSGRALLLTIALVMFGVAAVVYFVGLQPSRPPADAVLLDFRRLTAAIASDFSSANLEKCTQALRGQWARDEARVTEFRPPVIVILAADGAVSGNVQLRLAAPPAASPAHGDRVRFTGRVERLGQLETFPPMPNLYVYLTDGSIEPIASSSTPN